jgi:hypothetical protein
MCFHQRHVAEGLCASGKDYLGPDRGVIESMYFRLRPTSVRRLHHARCLAIRTAEPSRENHDCELLVCYKTNKRPQRYRYMVLSSVDLYFPLACSKALKIVKFVAQRFVFDLISAKHPPHC